MTRTFFVAVPVLVLGLMGVVVSPQSACPGGGPANAAPAAKAATTPAQKAYVAEAAKLHAQVRARSAELQALKAKPGPPSAALKAKQAEVGSARKKLIAYNVKNKAIRQQLGLHDCSTCPKGADCTGCSGAPTATCSHCATGAAAQGGCPMMGAAPSKAKAKTKPAAGGCPMHSGTTAKH